MGFDALRRTQEAMAESIESVLDGAMLPQTLLFSGHRGSLRLTAALDLAFTLTGEEGRELLSSSSICLFLSRPMRMVLNAASSLLRRQRNRRARIFYIQTVRKVLMQYHQAIAPLHREASGAKARDERTEGDRSVSAVASLIDESLMAIEEDREYSEEEIGSIVSLIDSYLTDAVINVGKKTPGATIEEIRAVQSWLSEGVDEKVVIFENPEDYAEGAKNSLLKLLEEPPEHAHLILISRSPSRLLETILSRCRRFSFPELSEAKVSAFIGEEFSIYSTFPSFDAFFFAEGSDESGRKAMEGYVESYLKAIVSGKGLGMKDEEEIFSGLERSGGEEFFRESLILRLEGLLREGRMAPGEAKRVYRSLSGNLLRSDTFNMPLRLALDLTLREVCDVE